MLILLHKECHIDKMARALGYAGGCNSVITSEPWVKAASLCGGETAVERFVRQSFF